MKNLRLGLQYRPTAALVALRIDGMAFGIPYDLHEAVAKIQRS
jgi:hypothetical protein